MRIVPHAALSALVLAAAVPAGAETINATISVETLNRDGICLVAFPRDDDMKLELSLRAKDANLNVNVQNIPSEWIDGHEDDNVPIEIKTDKGKTVKIPSGEYVAGFTYRVEGWGVKGDAALPLLSALKGGKSFTVEFGGHKVGKFEIQQTNNDMFKDYAYSFMQRCMGDAGGTTDF